jgi:hypothetical protein
VNTYGGVTYFRGTRGKLAPAAPTDQQYYNAFVQDTWQMGRLTLRPGIRWEQQKLTGVDPSLMRFPCHADDTRPGAVDGSGAEIPCTFTWKNLWAPRLGATFDITGTASRRSSRRGAGSTRRSRTTWPRARCRRTPASPARTGATPP